VCRGMGVLPSRPGPIDQAFLIEKQLTAWCMRRSEAANLRVRSNQFRAA
jgi:hypothetical protein